MNSSFLANTREIDIVMYGLMLQPIVNVQVNSLHISLTKGKQMDYKVWVIRMIKINVVHLLRWSLYYDKFDKQEDFVVKNSAKVH